jgi:glycosyltransferase involved in cell wall biosynthesis
MPLLEALAAGVVIIATPVGGTPLVVKNRVSGLLVPRNMADIVDALRHLESDRNGLLSMSAAAVNHYEQALTARGMAERHEALYRSLARPVVNRG